MLNHACGRCQSKKLRCDGLLPCNQCAELNIGAECQRTRRKDRIRKERLPRQRKIGSKNRKQVLVEQGASSYQTGTDSRPGLGKFISPKGEYGTPQGQWASEKLIIAAQDLMVSTSLSERILNEPFYWRALAEVHSCVHVPSLIRLVRDIFAGAANKDKESNIKVDDLCLCLISIALGIQYLPKDAITEPLIEQMLRSESPITPPARQQKMAQLARQWVLRPIAPQEYSLPQVQTIILLLVYGQDSEETEPLLFKMAVDIAAYLGMNCISSSKNLDVTQEMKVRSWWYLLSRSWLGSLTSSLYDMNHHHATRMPLEMNDLDLVGSPRHTGSNQDYLPVRYSISILQLSSIVKDLQTKGRSGVYSRKQLNEKTTLEISSYCSDLPERFSLSRPVIPPPGEENYFAHCKTAVEQWFLHQQLFHAFLELYHFEPDETIPDIAVSLALHILDTQTDYSKYCFIHDGFRVKVTNVVKACTLLMLNSMQRIQSGHQSSVSRSTNLRKVVESIRKCQFIKGSVQSDFTFLFDVMNMEDGMWTLHSTRPAETQSPEESMQSTSIGSSVVREDISYADSDLASFWDFESSSFSNSLIPSPGSDAEIEKIWSSLVPTDVEVNPLFGSDSVQVKWQEYYTQMQCQ